MSSLVQDLVSASRDGDLKKVTGILQGLPPAGSAILDSVGADCHTALTTSCQNDHLEVVKVLVQAGADPDKFNEWGTSALMQAAYGGRLEVVKFLMQAGADMEKQHYRCGTTALLWAAQKGHLEVVKFLVQAGADKEKKDQAWYTALMHAAENGHLQVVKVLVQAGADTKKKSMDGKTAYNLASTEYIKEFLAQQSSPAAANSPLDSAAPASAPATAPPPPSPSSQPSLVADCERVLQQVACAPQRRDLTQRIRSLQALLDAAEGTDDFEQVVSLGPQVLVLQHQSAQLPLSEEDYLTLADRHAALVQRVIEQCRELTRAKDYGALGPLSAKLKELKALNLTGIVVASVEDAGGAKDPMLPLPDHKEDVTPCYRYPMFTDPVVISSTQC